MGSVEQQVIITMSAQTITALLKSGFILYGFKAVQCSDKAGMPLLWFQTQNYSARTMLSWSNQYQGYTSNSVIVPNSRIEVGFCADMALGQILSVKAGGFGDVTAGGVATALSLLNTSQTQCICGISEQYGSICTPSCVFPLYGGGWQLIAPLDQVLLLFSTQPIKTGAVVEVSYGPGIWIDMSSANLRQVSYDINQNWSWGNYAWARSILANSQLAPLLIQPSTYLAQRRLDLLSMRGILS